jgi:hypothetical protein
MEEISHAERELDVPMEDYQMKVILSQDVRQVKYDEYDLRVEGVLARLVL